MKTINFEIVDLLRCVNCGGMFHVEDPALVCNGCGFRAPIENGAVDFLDKDERERLAEDAGDFNFQMAEMSGSTALARAYRFGGNFISCDYVPFKQLDRFLEGIERDKIIVELGSGNRKLSDRCINVDLFPFSNVDILADIRKTPFNDRSVDYVVIDAVLEHVPEPHSVVREIFRILKPGGKVFCLVPFIHPYHGYPKNYFNISYDGLQCLFKEFSDCKVEAYRGPTSAAIGFFAEYIALAFSTSERGLLYMLLRGAALLPIFFLKYLDRFWDPRGPGLRISNALCAIVTK
jgi:SAM-dependent methyltransferase